MKNRNVLVIAFLSLLAVISCRKDNDITILEDFPLTSINGFVTNEQNKGLVQSEVEVNGTKTFTDANGYFSVNNVSHKGKIVINVKKSGYFEGSRTIHVRSKEKAFAQISLFEKKFDYNFESTNGGILKQNDNVSIDFPANAIIDKSGNNYNGIVNVSIRYLDPTLPSTYYAMPGTLVGIDQNNENAVLESYGMVGVWLSDINGNNLQIKPGQKCKMSTKIPENMLNYAPVTIPLWHYDEKEGLWKEEGQAQRNGDYYVGNVSHFSFWNCDYPRPLVYIKGKLKDQNGNPTEGIVSIGILGQNIQNISTTNQLGEFEGLVPANLPLVFEIKDLCNKTIYSTELGPLTTDQDLGDIQVQTINNPQNISVNGMVKGCDGLPSPDAIIAIITNGKRIDFTADKQGKFSFNIANCNANVLEIKAISVQDEKESFTISILPTANLTNIILNACDQNIEEYATINFSNGEKFKYFYNLYFLENSGISSNGIEPEGFFIDYGNHIITVNTPFSSVISYFKDKQYIFASTNITGTTIFSKFVSDKTDFSSFYEGSFQMKGITKREYDGFVYPLTESDLSATGEFRFKND